MCSRTDSKQRKIVLHVNNARHDRLDPPSQFSTRKTIATRPPRPIAPPKTLFSTTFPVDFRGFPAKKGLIAGPINGHYVSVSTEWRQTGLLNVDRSADDCSYPTALPRFLRDCLVGLRDDRRAQGGGEEPSVLLRNSQLFLRFFRLLFVLLKRWHLPRNRVISVRDL